MPVYKDKERGTWYVKRSITVNGRTHQQKKRGFTTKKEAVLWESQQTADRIMHVSMTFNEMLTEQLKFINSSKTSSDMKRSWIAKHFPYGDKPIERITKPMLVKWRNSLENTPLATRTINRGLGYVRAVFAYGNAIYGIQDNGKAIMSYKLTKKDKEEMSVWTVEQFRQFIDAVPPGYYRAYFTYLFWTGCRRSEALALCKDDVQGNMVHIYRSIKHFQNGFLPLKTDSSERTIALGQETLKAIKPYLIKADPFVFGGVRSLPITCVQKEFEKAIEISGVPRIRIHDLRHSHATMLINNGANIIAVSKRLGHSDINITLKTYAHVLKKTEDEMLNIIEELEKAPVPLQMPSQSERSYERINYNASQKQ